MIVLSHWSFSFVNLNLDSWLVVSIGGKYLSLLDWNGGVLLNDLGHDSAGSLNSQRQWGDIQQENLVQSLALFLVQYSGLNGSSVGNSLVWVDGSVQLLSVEELGQQLLDHWDS